MAGLAISPATQNPRARQRPAESNGAPLWAVTTGGPVEGPSNSGRSRADDAAPLLRVFGLCPPLVLYWARNDEKEPPWAAPATPKPLSDLIKSPLTREPSMTVQPSHIRPNREIRQLVRAIADAAENERQQYRGRKRRQGDCGRGFFEDPDRFALAAMMAMQMSGNDVLIHFGTRRSDWAAALHAASLMSPGRGQRVTYVHYHEHGSLHARAVFMAPDRHETAARRLDRKRRALEGLPQTWACLSACLLNTLNAGVTGAARTHTLALLGLLGWHAIPRAVWARLAQVVEPSNISALQELLFNDDPPVGAHDRRHSRSVASVRTEHEPQTRPAPEHRRRHPGTPGPRPHQGARPR